MSSLRKQEPNLLYCLYVDCIYPGRAPTRCRVLKSDRTPQVVLIVPGRSSQAMVFLHTTIALRKPKDSPNSLLPLPSMSLGFAKITRYHTNMEFPHIPHSRLRGNDTILPRLSLSAGVSHQGRGQLHHSAKGQPFFYFSFSASTSSFSFSTLIGARQR